MKTVIATTAAPGAIGPYSQAIEAGGFVFVSGQIPLDPATGAFVPGGVEEQAEDDAGLEAPATDEECRGQGEAEVAAVERKLDEGGLRVAHGHDALEGGKQRVGHVVGKAPEEEHARDQCEGDGVASVDRFHYFTMPFSRYSARFMRTLAAAPSEATFAMS